jgi:hypothetical protein
MFSYYAMLCGCAGAVCRSPILTFGTLTALMQWQLWYSRKGAKDGVKRRAENAAREKAEALMEEGVKPASSPVGESHALNGAQASTDYQLLEQE